MPAAKLDEIRIRNQLEPGDLGYVIHLHGRLYRREYGYGLEFETYVAEGLVEFMRGRDPLRDRVWVCEHEDRMVGFLLALHRGEAVQLRYFLIESAYRGLGLGRKLLGLFLDFVREQGYRSAYLWTTHELAAAAHLYTDAGFRLTEEKDSLAFGKALRERRYDLELPPPA